MLKYLNIKNIILIDSLEITLENGFNVITGETGAGKSAIISALKLLIGHRSESKIIRKGTTKASVEAIFEVKPLSDIYSILQESGVEIYPNEELLIKREILPNGKGKVYINHQMAQITLLKKIGEYLIQIVGQHANQRLFKEEEHRNIIDVYGDLIPLVYSYQAVWKELHQIECELKTLIEGEAFRIREMERCRDEIEEIEQAKIKESEEEELFAEYTLLIHKEELLKKATAIYASLQGGEGSILHQLNKKRYLFEALISIDPSIKDSFVSYRNACLEIEEVSHVLNNYLYNLDNNPEHSDIINERLSLINKIKRKYGPTFQEIVDYLTASKEKLKQMENCDLQIEELKEKAGEFSLETELNHVRRVGSARDCSTQQSKRHAVRRSQLRRDSRGAFLHRRQPAHGRGPGARRAAVRRADVRPHGHTRVDDARRRAGSSRAAWGARVRFGQQEDDGSGRRGRRRQQTREGADARRRNAE